MPVDGKLISVFKLEIINSEKFFAKYLIIEHEVTI